jgi:hypothetical protein
MKQLRDTRSVAVVRHRGARLAAVVAAAVALGAAAAVPAQARHRPPRHRDQASQQAVAAAVVNFRQNAIFSCFGAVGGFPNANTANIFSPNVFTVTAIVTVTAPPGSTFFGQLTQSGCVRTKFFTVTVPFGSTTGTAVVSDLRVSNAAFVYLVGGVTGLQITPLVLL